MSAPVERQTMSYAEYLALEERASERHEYVNGLVYAMAGGSPEHGALCAAISSALSVALHGRPCRVYSSDTRLRINETQTSTYPDVSVVCGTLVTAEIDASAISNPVVVVEVLSPSTEGYDRGAKARHCRRLTSLKEYILISQDEVRVEVQRRNGNGFWELHFFGQGELVVLESLGVSFAVDLLYRNPLKRE
jgi:Uma2 family endonuclease